MKAGDLVRWTHDDDAGVGIILSVERLPDQYGCGEAIIFWSPSSRQPIGHTGIYPARHQYMEVCSESR